MFALFGLAIVGTIVLLCGWCLLLAANALTNKRKGIALAYGIPVLCIAGLLLSGILWNYPEADPQDVFTRLFEMAPPPGVTQLRAYSDDDELNPIYLQFEAPHAVVQTLLKSKFQRAPGALAFRAIAQPEHISRPAWFDANIAPEARVYSLGPDRLGPHGIALYDLKLNRVRIYLDGPELLHR